MATKQEIFKEKLGEYLAARTRKEKDGIEMTRTRPYMKNDHARIEQKNYTNVRHVVGYTRFDDPRHVAILNELYDALEEYINFFVPSMVCVKKERIGSRHIRRYDRAATAYSRVLAHPDIDQDVKERLQQITQLARCGECGCAITAQYATNHFGTRYTYYHCTEKQGKCAQPYIQESALAAQFQSLLQSVSLPLEEIEIMEKQIDTWEHESISSRGEVAQNLKSKLSETQEKLDRLVSLYLDGDIERDLYLVKKDALLRQKAKLEESLGDFGQQGKNRLEPLRSFVLFLKEAKKAAQTKNYAEWRNFFRSLGSNPEIKDKTLSINWGELWDFTAKIKADFALRSAAYSPRGAVHFEKVNCGAVIIHFARTYYERKIRDIS